MRGVHLQYASAGKLLLTKSYYAHQRNQVFERVLCGRSTAGSDWQCVGFPYCCLLTLAALPASKRPWKVLLP